MGDTRLNQLDNRCRHAKVLFLLFSFHGSTLTGANPIRFLVEIQGKDFPPDCVPFLSDRAFLFDIILPLSKIASQQPNSCVSLSILRPICRSPIRSQPQTGTSKEHCTTFLRNEQAFAPDLSQIIPKPGLDRLSCLGPSILTSSASNVHIFTPYTRFCGDVCQEANDHHSRARIYVPTTPRQYPAVITITMSTHYRNIQ